MLSRNEQAAYTPAEFNSLHLKVFSKACGQMYFDRPHLIGTMKDGQQPVHIKKNNCIPLQLTAVTVAFKTNPIRIRALPSFITVGRHVRSLRCCVLFQDRRHTPLLCCCAHISDLRLAPFFFVLLCPSLFFVLFGSQTERLPLGQLAGLCGRHSDAGVVPASAAAAMSSANCSSVAASSSPATATATAFVAAAPSPPSAAAAAAVAVPTAEKTCLAAPAQQSSAPVPVPPLAVPSSSPMTAATASPSLAPAEELRAAIQRVEELYAAQQAQLQDAQALAKRLESQSAAHAAEAEELDWQLKKTTECLDNVEAQLATAELHLAQCKKKLAASRAEESS